MHKYFRAGHLISIITTGMGMVLFLYPFLFPELVKRLGANLHQGDFAYSVTGLLVICLAVMLYQIQAEKLDTRMVALLGVLIAINSALRFLETAFPGPAGFTPIFFLVIMVGYIFGGQIGFLMGALTMAVSAVVTGGVGPWLPGQMLTAGWVGMTAPAVRFFVHLLRGEETRKEVILLCAAGAVWGILYGLIINLWFWPLIAGPVEQSWQPGTDAGTILNHYLTYYALTSLIWDLAAGAGNVLMIAAFGLPTLRALRRFSRRFSFQQIQMGQAPEEDRQLERQS